MERIFDNEVAGVVTVFETGSVFRVAFKESQIIAAYILNSSDKEPVTCFILSAM